MSTRPKQQELRLDKYRADCDFHNYKSAALARISKESPRAKAIASMFNLPGMVEWKWRYSGLASARP
jgi:hypothetical protein